MAEPDALAVVEAGYRWIEDEREWLRGIADAARPFAPGGGVAAYTLDLAERPQIPSFVGVRTERAFEARVRAFTSGFDPSTARLMFAPTEFVGNALHRLRRSRAHARSRSNASRAATRCR